MALPGYPPTGHVMSRSSQGKKIIFIWGSAGEGGGALMSSRPTLLWTFCWVTRYPAARSTSHSGQRTLWLSLYWCVRPSPVILSPQDSVECPPIAQQGWHAILAVLPTLVYGQTRPNSSIRMLNA